MGRRARHSRTTRAPPVSEAGSRAGERARSSSRRAPSTATRWQRARPARVAHPGSRREYAATVAGGLEREDAWQRATELLFERLAVSWTIAGLETHPPEGAARALPDGVDRRAAVRARLAPGARRRALPRAGGAVIDPDAFAALLCDWCLEAVRAPAGADRLDDARRAAGARAARRRCSSAGRGRCCGCRPGLARATSTRTRATGQLDEFPPLELIEVAGGRRIRADRRARRHAGARGDRSRRGCSARCGRASRSSDARLAKRWCGTIWPTPALAEQAGMGEAEYAAFLNRALFLDRPDPVAAWGELCERQQQLVVERLGRCARDPDRGATAPTCAWRSPDGRGSTPTDAGTCRAARCSPVRSRTPPRARSASRSRPTARVSRCAASSSTFEAGEGRGRSRRARRAAPALGARDGPGRAASLASSGSAPTPGSTAPPARRCSTRRSPAPSIWRSGARTRRRAAATHPRCTGT